MLAAFDEDARELHTPTVLLVLSTDSEREAALAELGMTAYGVLLGQEETRLLAELDLALLGRSCQVTSFVRM